MNRIITVIMLAVVILTIFIFNNNGVILLILTGIILLTFTIDFIKNRMKIKSGKCLKIGKNKREIWTSVLYFSIGFILILLGLFFKISSNWNGLDYKFFCGLILISESILRYDDSIIIVKEKTIQFNEFLNRSEWEIVKIEKAVIDNNNFRFEMKGNVIEFTVDDYEISTLTQKLTEKMNSRLIIEQI